MYKTLNAGFAVVALALMVGCATVERSADVANAGDVAGMAAWVENRVEEAARKGRLEGGLVVSVYGDGQTMYAGGSGWADGNKDEPLTGNTPMAIGSISKLFTAVAIMQLAEQGKVALDDPIAAYLPDLAMADGAESRVTIRDLLTHHGGLPGDIFADWITPEAGLGALRRLPVQLEGVPLAAAPGEYFSYSNIGFALLGLTIEAASGQAYDHYIRDNLFEPAGIVQSEVYRGESGLDLPQGHTRKGLIDIPAIRDVPAGSLIVSAADMARFVQTLFADTDGLLRRETRDSMFVRQNGGNPIDRDFAIGLGFWLIDPMETGEVVAAHAGNLPPAFNATLITLPELDLAVFVAANDERAANLQSELAMEIMTELLVWSGQELPTKEPAGDFLPVPPDEAEAFAGTYATIAGLIDVERRGNAFKANVSRNTLHFGPREGGGYGVEVRPLGLIPMKVPALEAMEFDMFVEDGVSWMGIWMGGVYAGAYARLDSVSYPSVYESYAGSYQVVGAEVPVVDGSPAIADVAVARDGDRYVLFFQLMGMPMKAALRPVGAATAVTDGRGRGSGELVRFSGSGNSVVLEWSGFRFGRDE